MVLTSDGKWKLDQADQPEEKAQAPSNSVQADVSARPSPEQSDVKKKPSLPMRLTGGLFRLVARLLLIALFIAIGLFVGGFLKFSTTIVERQSSPAIETSDAIAVLTGGSRRIMKALELLQQGKGQRLLISGVNPETPLGDLRKTYPQFGSQFECCVDVETVAADTVGNAIETAKWVRANDYKSLIIVTSGYHMPRALVEFRRQLPEIKLVSYPVSLKALKRKDWWHKPENLHLLLSEYIKYLGASSRKFSPSFLMM